MACTLLRFTLAARAGRRGGGIVQVRGERDRSLGTAGRDGMHDMNGDDPAARPDQPACPRRKGKAPPRAKAKAKGAGGVDCAARKAGADEGGSHPPANIFRWQRHWFVHLDQGLV